MLTVHSIEGGRLVTETVEAGQPFPRSALWFDLFQPTMAELDRVASALGLELPSEEDMQEIEVSSRLYRVGEALMMTAIVLSRADTSEPVSRAITFVLTRAHLVTLRHTQPLPFARFKADMAASCGAYRDAPMLFAGLVQAVIARSADVLERLAGELDQISRGIFGRSDGARPLKTHQFKQVLRDLGAKNDLVMRIQESLFSLARLVQYPEQAMPGTFEPSFVDLLHTAGRDILSLRDQTQFLSDRVEFLLEVIVGLINVEQNNIVRVMSVMATMLMPPTLIASVYGMNFDVMPELGWPYGYPLALAGMVLAGLVPFLVIRLRGWL